jgi:hypothetical protein
MLIDIWECLDCINIYKGLEEYREDTVRSADVVICWM